VPAYPRCCRLAVVVVFLAISSARSDDKPFGFEVTFAPEVSGGPISGRVYVMLGPSTSARAPRFGPDWMKPDPFFAVAAVNWKPGEPLAIGPDAAGYPSVMKDLKRGTYAAQAVVRLNPDTHKLGDGEGNAYGPVVEVKFEPGAAGLTALRIDQVVSPEPLKETERIKSVDIPSPLLSAFHKRPIRLRAAVILPEDAAERAGRLPTVYIIPGFGGDHHMAPVFLRSGRFSYAKDMIRVILDPDCGTGHHVFADSATNGPRGRALIEELIPHIEKTFAVEADPGARLLNGHSSGGWSGLWLQVTYPDFFGGTWSTSPDPVDFRDFSAIDLYAPNQNLFHDAQGQARPIARFGGKPQLFVEGFSHMEDVVGDGGQLHSFEAVFSPRGADGRPRKLWDRQTGAVDPAVAKAWEAYDIRLALEHNWPTLGSKLAGKLHVITGEVDNFYLEGAVRLLKESLQKLGSDAIVEIVPKKDHMTLLDSAMAARIDREMREAVSKRRPKADEAGGAAR
jgi:hypothetical protein